MTMISDRSVSFGYGLSFLGPEFLDEREYKPVILFEKTLQIFTAVGPCMGLFDHARIREVIVDLVVEFVPVGDDDERPVAGNLPQDLLGEEDHRVALATALRVPEDTEPSLCLSVPA